MQTTGHVDHHAARVSLNTLAANINRRLEWWYATGLFPPALVGAVGLWCCREHLWLSGILISFAAFVLTLALWYRAVVRPVACRYARRVAHAVDSVALASLTNQTQWPHLRHALHICPSERPDPAVHGTSSTLALSERLEK